MLRRAQLWDCMSSVRPWRLGIMITSWNSSKIISRPMCCLTATWAIWFLPCDASRSAVMPCTCHSSVRLSVTVHRCLNGLAPAYVTELCTPVTQSRSSCRLRSSYRNRLAVPSVKLTLGSRSFSVSGPTVWNALPDYLRIPPFPLMFSNVI